MDEGFTAYVAGFFDGEGSVTIARQANRPGGGIYHKVIVAIGQRAQHRRALDLICARFGGSVSVSKQRISGGFTDPSGPARWADQARWQLQKWSDISAFLVAIQPYVIVKAKQVAIALAFLEARSTKTTNSRDALGRVRRDLLTTDELALRESYREQMLEANALGPRSN